MITRAEVSYTVRLVGGRWVRYVLLVVAGCQARVIAHGVGVVRHASARFMRAERGDRGQARESRTDR